MEVSEMAKNEIREKFKNNDAEENGDASEMRQVGLSIFNCSVTLLSTDAADELGSMSELAMSLLKSMKTLDGDKL